MNRFAQESRRVRHTASMDMANSPYAEPVRIAPSYPLPCGALSDRRIIGRIRRRDALTVLRDWPRVANHALLDWLSNADNLFVVYAPWIKRSCHEELALADLAATAR